MAESVVSTNDLRRWIEKNPEATREQLLAFIEERSKVYYLSWDITDIEEVCGLTEEESTALTEELRFEIMDTFARRADFSCSVSNEDLREAYRDVVERH
jgi:hypothetical protein